MAELEETLSRLNKSLNRLDRCMTYLIGDPDIPEDKGVVHDLQEALQGFRNEVKDRLSSGDRNFTRLEAEVAAMRARCEERLQSCPARSEGTVRKITKKPFLIGGSIITFIGTLAAIVYEVIKK